MKQVTLLVGFVLTGFGLGSSDFFGLLLTLFSFLASFSLGSILEHIDLGFLKLLTIQDQIVETWEGKRWN